MLQPQRLPIVCREFPLCSSALSDITDLQGRLVAVAWTPINQLSSSFFSPHHRRPDDRPVGMDPSFDTPLIRPFQTANATVEHVHLVRHLQYIKLQTRTKNNGCVSGDKLVIFFSSVSFFCCSSLSSHHHHTHFYRLYRDVIIGTTIVTIVIVIIIIISPECAQWVTLATAKPFCWPSRAA